MKRFAALYDALDRTTSTNAKVAALSDYFHTAPAADAAWVLFFLTGRRLKRHLPAALLRDWAAQQAHIPDWLFDESYAAVGDFAETITLLLDTAAPASAATIELPLSQWMAERILPLRAWTIEQQAAAVMQWWSELDRGQIFLLNKLLTGAFRVGVSATLVMRALAQVAGVSPSIIAHRLMGSWEPTAAFFAQLVQPAVAAVERSQPYPFFLASPLEGSPQVLGAREEWLAEWKWDGIRAQLIRRAEAVYVWSRGEELITERFPEIVEAAQALPTDVVLDGEILAFKNDRPLPFAVLQRRIGRQRLTAKILAEAPAAFIAYDVLEDAGSDIREQPLSARRARLLDIVDAGSPRLRISEALAGDWNVLAAQRDAARARQVEGLMLKRLRSPYRAGRKRGDWWKWKVDPFAIDAVLVYAQPGNGRRANLFTDYTFAVWDNGTLLPIAKAYSGLSDEEIAALDRWIRRHTLERFGPVRAVEPVHVFELHFEAIARSSRHKSGIAVRFPRIARWRTDKPPSEADTLQQVEAMIR